MPALRTHHTYVAVMAAVAAAMAMLIGAAAATQAAVGSAAHSSFRHRPAPTRREQRACASSINRALIRSSGADAS